MLACIRPEFCWNYGQDLVFGQAIRCVGIMNNSAGPGGPPDQPTASEGTNVVRVPFGVRRARRRRPERPERWATVVLPFQVVGGDPTPPPQAA